MKEIVVIDDHVRAKSVKKHALNVVRLQWRRHPIAIARAVEEATTLKHTILGLSPLAFLPGPS